MHGTLDVSAEDIKLADDLFLSLEKKFGINIREMLAAGAQPDAIRQELRKALSLYLADDLKRDPPAGWEKRDDNNWALQYFADADGQPGLA